MPGVIGIGYQGRDLPALLAELTHLGVTRLVDVRQNAISRKPGFAKTALRTALASAGIAYDHYPELGNPRDNRPGLAATGPRRTAAQATYERLLTTPEARAALATLTTQSRTDRIALLCYEANPAHCHRTLLLTHLPT
jgi:uncharacterized protein (DUF488 family)